MPRYNFTRDELNDIVQQLSTVGVNIANGSVVTMNRAIKQFMKDNNYNGSADIQARSHWLINYIQTKQNEREMNEFLNAVQPEQTPQIRDVDARREQYEFVNAFTPEPAPRYETRNVEARRKQREQFIAEQNELLESMGAYADDMNNIPKQQFEQLRKDIRVQLGKWAHKHVQEQHSTARIEKQRLETILNTIDSQMNDMVNMFGAADAPMVDISQLLTFDQSNQGTMGKFIVERLRKLNGLPENEPLYLQVNTIDGKTRNFSVTPDTINQLIDMFEKLAIEEGNPEPFIYEDDAVTIPSVTYLREFRIIPYSVAYPYTTNTSPKRSKRTLGWFPFMLKSTTPQWLKDALIPAQIVADDDSPKARDSVDSTNWSIFDDCCLTYALKQAGANADLIANIETARLTDSRFKAASDIVDIWNEYNIPYALIYMNEHTHKREYYCGSREDHLPELVFLCGHIFFNSQTNISKYNLDHLNEDIDYSNVKLGGRLRNDIWKYDVHNYTMEELILYLLAHDLFIPWTITNLMKIPKVTRAAAISTINTVNSYCCKSIREVNTAANSYKSTIPAPNGTSRNCVDTITYIEGSVDKLINQFTSIEMKVGEIMIQGVTREGKHVRIQDVTQNPLINTHKLIFDIAPADYLTTAEVAKAILDKHVFNKCADLYAYSGSVDKFIRQAIYGGRCIVKDNKKWHLTEPMAYLDVNSLYPAAVARIQLPKGKPELFTDCSFEDLCNYDYYVVNVRFADGSVKTIDKQTLEDMIDYEGLGIDAFTVVTGYRWSSGVFNGLAPFINQLYALKQNAITPAERKAYKLILNSAYGKLIQRPKTTRTVIKTDVEVGDYVLNNQKMVISDKILPNGMHEITLNKGVNKSWSYTLFGCMVLSMAKHIMNEYFSLASKHNIPIYYSHTDSLMLPYNKLDVFKTFIGDGLGQLKNELGHDAISIETFIIKKTQYMCVVKTANGETKYHIRNAGKKLPDDVNPITYFADLFLTD